MSQAAAQLGLRCRCERSGLSRGGTASMPIREKGPRRAGWWPVGPLSRHNPCPDRRENRASSTVAAEFTGETDSAAEGDGFEPSVPLRNRGTPATPPPALRQGPLHALG